MVDIEFDGRRRSGFSRKDEVEKVLQEEFCSQNVKDSVTSFHWTDYILETHSDAIESLLQCQSIAIFEGWHYTVYDETLQTCYFGMVKTDKTVLEISDDSNR